MNNEKETFIIRIGIIHNRVIKTKNKKKKQKKNAYGLIVGLNRTF